MTALLVSRSGISAAIRAVRSHLQPQDVVVVGLDDDPEGANRTDYDHVFLHDVPADQPLPPGLLRDIFSRTVQSIQHIDEDGITRPHQPFAGFDTRPRVLNVYPGEVMPLDKGANRRAFELTLHLNRAGIATDLLVGTRFRRRQAWLGQVLTAIAPQALVYYKDKPALSVAQRLRRETERVYRGIRGTYRSAPDLFAERLRTRASRDGAQKLRDLIASGRYQSIIVNYAWMTGMADLVREVAPPGTQWLCDTHDVHFARGESLNRLHARLGVKPAREREAELAALRKYQGVVAISSADAGLLARALPGAEILLAPGGFDYAEDHFDCAPARPPYRFGFIGCDMDANVSAFAKLVKEWWPEIQARAPGSHLAVAGTLCRRREVRDLAAQHLEIDLLGFVPSLKDFYRRIDIALNPVTVQGGLNFKSVEAMAAGRLLITTPLGARCLGESGPFVVADSGGDVGTAVAQWVAAPDRLESDRRTGQTWCLMRFGEDQAFRPLREFLTR